MEKTKRIWYNIKNCKGGIVMERNKLVALAYDEAARLKEDCFNHYHPYTCWIEIPAGVSYADEDLFYSMVEDELKIMGEEITRDGKFFKINRFQSHK